VQVEKEILKTMAIKPKCNMCKKELEDFGGILLSPPSKEEMVRKFHLCKKCYEKIAVKMKG